MLHIIKQLKGVYGLCFQNYLDNNPGGGDYYDKIKSEGDDKLINSALKKIDKDENGLISVSELDSDSEISKIIKKAMGDDFKGDQYIEMGAAKKLLEGQRNEAKALEKSYNVHKEYIVKTTKIDSNEVKSEVIDYKKIEGMSYRDLKNNKEAVTILQKLVIKLGEELPKFGVDGDYGSELSKAVSNLQTKFSLGIDGKAGTETIAKLISEYKATLVYKPTFKDGDLVRVKLNGEYKKGNLVDLGDGVYKVGGNTLFSLDNVEHYVEDVSIKTEPLNLTKSLEVNTPDIKTKESAGEIKSMFGEKMKANELLENTNIESLNKLMDSKSIDELKTIKNTLISLSEGAIRKTQNDKGEETQIYSFSFVNTGEQTKYLTGLGYESDGVFGPDEFNSIFQIIEDRVKTQENISEMTQVEKFQIMFDYNKDRLLTNDVHFNTKEKELFSAIKTEREFDNLFSNLGLGGSAEFESDINDNYSKSRIDFMARLATVLDGGVYINPGDLIKYPDALKQKYESLSRLTEIKEVIENTFNGNEKFQEIYGKNPEFADRYKESMIIAILGDVKGGVISFDVPEALDKLLDTAHFGIMNGVPGLGFSKNVLDLGNGEFKIDLGTVNFIPYISNSAKLTKTVLEEFKNLFPTKLEDTINISIGSGISANGIVSAGIDFTKVDENSKEGMMLAKEKMWDALDKLFINIKSGKTFEDLNINDNDSNREAYNRLLEQFNQTDKSDLAITALKQGALNNYQTDLYKNASGELHKTGISIGVMTGYIIPLIHGEYHSVEYKKVQEKDRELMSFEVNGYDEKAVNNTKKVNSYISKILREDALLSNDTPGMMNLQKTIHEYNNGNVTIGNTWDELVHVLREPKFVKNYAKDFKTELAYVESILLNNNNNLEQNLIIKNVATNLMKKSGIDIKEKGIVELKDGKTVLEYDRSKNRDEFFDKIFSREFPDIADKIKEARDNYLEANKDVKSFKIAIATIDGGVGFSGVEIAKTKETGINKYVGGYHLAEMPTGVNVVEIKGKSKDVVNKLPDLVLTNIKNELYTKLGVELKDLNAVKEFINNGGDENFDLDYKLYFGKDPECLNDKVILKDIEIKETKLGRDSIVKIGVYSSQLNTTHIGAAYTKKIDNNNGGNGGGDGGEDPEDPNKGNEGPGDSKGSTGENETVIDNADTVDF